MAAGTEINDGISYTLSYQDEQGLWRDITSAGGATVGYIGREYRVRFRFRFPDTLILNQRYDINFTLNHQASSISGVNLTVVDFNGTVLSSAECDYDSLVAQDNSSHTRTTINIYGFRCTTASWITLSFSYYSNSAVNPAGDTTGLLVAGVASLSITDSSTDATIIEFQNTVHNDFMDLIDNNNNNTQNIIDNQDSNTDEIVSAVDSSNDELMDLIDGHNGGGGGHIFGKMDEQTSLLDSIFDGIGTIGSDIDSFFGGFFSNMANTIKNAIQWLFIPDLDELQEFIEDSIDDFRESTPLLASLLSVFDTIISGFNSGTVSDSFEIPSYTLHLPQDTDWTFDAVTVPLFPRGLNGLLIPTRNFLAVVTSVLILRFVFFKLFSALGFSGRDNPSELEDGD